MIKRRCLFLYPEDLKCPKHVCIIITSQIFCQLLVFLCNYIEFTEGIGFLLRIFKQLVKTCIKIYCNIYFNTHKCESCPSRRELRRIIYSKTPRMMESKYKHMNLYEIANTICWKSSVLYYEHSLL